MRKWSAVADGSNGMQGSVGVSMREREDRKKHRVGKEENALKLLCSLSCCFLLLT